MPRNNPRQTKHIKTIKRLKITCEGQEIDTCPEGHKLEAVAIDENWAIYCGGCNRFYTLRDLRHPEIVEIKAPKFANLHEMGFEV